MHYKFHVSKTSHDGQHHTMDNIIQKMEMVWKATVTIFKDNFVETISRLLNDDTSDEETRQGRRWTTSYKNEQHHTRITTQSWLNFHINGLKPMIEKFCERDSDLIFDGVAFADSRSLRAIVEKASSNCLQN